MLNENALGKKISSNINLKNALSPETRAIKKFFKIFKNYFSDIYKFLISFFFFFTQRKVPVKYFS